MQHLGKLKPHVLATLPLMPRRAILSTARLGDQASGIVVNAEISPEAVTTCCGVQTASRELDCASEVLGGRASS